MTPASIIIWIVIAAGLGLLGWRIHRALTTGPGGDLQVGACWYLVKAFTRFFHRPTCLGLEHVPEGNDPGSLIVVSNHTAGVDPFLIQAPCRFLIRWMMARETMSPRLNWFWERVGIIPVDRRGRDSGPLREAIRHVKEGGVVGIFPEGGLVNPPGEIRPFMPGVGLLISRTKAPVLLVFVSGTPHCKSASASLTKFSHARVEFLGMFDFEGIAPEDIVRQLREHLAEASGWPLNEEPVPTALKREEEDQESAPAETDADPFAP